VTMHASHTDLDGLGLNELIARLRDVNTTRTPLGWPTEQAVTKAAIERRIVQLVTRREPAPVDDASQQLSCELPFKVRSANRPSVKADRVTLQPGGMFVETDAPIEVGEPVEIEIATDGVFRLRSRGNVGYRAHGKPGKPAGIGIGFTTVVGESAERRLERLVLELIRNRAH
jgi:Tfp pilus assembly protein PilZ